MRKLALLLGVGIRKRLAFSASSGIDLNPTFNGLEKNYLLGVFVRFTIRRSISPFFRLIKAVNWCFYLPTHGQPAQFLFSPKKSVDTESGANYSETTSLTNVRSLRLERAPSRYFTARRWRWLLWAWPDCAIAARIRGFKAARDYSDCLDHHIRLSKTATFISNLKHKSHDLIFFLWFGRSFICSSFSLCFRKCHRFIYRVVSKKRKHKWSEKSWGRLREGKWKSRFVIFFGQRDVVTETVVR